MLDKQNPIPLYHQLKEALALHIASGEWEPGAQLPSERELCDQYAISRITVRQALAELVIEGKLKRDQGRGTFVAQPRIQQHLSHLTGFTQDMRARGKHPGARVLNLTHMPAPALVARAMGIRMGTSVIALKRLRTANDEPLALETSYLSASRCQGLAIHDVEDHSLYDLLVTRFDIVPARAEQEMHATACAAAEARLLGIRSGSPVLHILRTTFDLQGRPFEYVESYYRGDKYVFHAELKVDAPADAISSTSRNGKPTPTRTRRAMTRPSPQY